MKFLYLIPLLLPQVTLACISSTRIDLAGLIGLSFTFIVVISLAINCLVLLVMKLLPRNKGVPIATIFTKAKKLMITVVVLVALVILGVISLYPSQSSYVDPNRVTLC